MLALRLLQVFASQQRVSIIGAGNFANRLLRNNSLR